MQTLVNICWERILVFLCLRGCFPPSDSQVKLLGQGGSCLSWRAATGKHGSYKEQVKPAERCRVFHAFISVRARPFIMLSQTLCPHITQVLAPLSVASGASQAKRAPLQCRGVHGQQNSQQSWPLRLSSAGAGLAALAYLAVASPARTRPLHLRALKADDEFC